MNPSKYNVGSGPIENIILNIAVAAKALTPGSPGNETTNIVDVTKLVQMNPENFLPMSIRTYFQLKYFG